MLFWREQKLSSPGIKNTFARLDSTQGKNAIFIGNYAQKGRNCLYFLKKVFISQVVFLKEIFSTNRLL